jgi:hypothetical protein
MVEKFYQGAPIIEITALSGKKLSEGAKEQETEIVLDKTS